MKRIVQILFMVFILQIVSFSSANVNDEGYIEAEGIVYPEPGQTPNQMRRVAIMDGYRYLAEQVNNIYVTSESTVKNLRDLDDRINTKVETALRGAEVISVIREKDGSFHATVRMPLYKSNLSLAAAVLQEDIDVEEFLKPKFTNIRSEIHYTGLAVDCRNLNLSVAVSPVIKSVSGLEIYSYKNIGYQNAIGKGIAEYSSNIDSARAGNSPLVIKAVKISGACNVIVSDEDADKILSANQQDKFLNNCAVVFVR